MLAPHPNQRSENLKRKLDGLWEREKLRRRPSLLRALWSMFAYNFVVIALLAFVTASLVGTGFYQLALIVDSLVKREEGPQIWL